MAEYDLLIKNGTIIDGLRIPRYRGDIAIRAGKIVAIGNIQGSATRVIDLQPATAIESGLSEGDIDALIEKFRR